MKLLADPVATPVSAPVDLTGYAKIADLPTPQNLTPLTDRITSLEESIGEIRIYTSTAEAWPSTLKPGEAIQFLSASGNLTALTINSLPATLTAIWIAGRKQAAATSVTVKDIRRATARILDNQLIIECGYTEANLIWSTQTTVSGVYSSAVQGLPNMREALRRWRFRVQFVLAASTTAAQFLSDAQSSPLANYTGPNGVAIATEPTLDLLRFTPFGGTEVYSSAALDPARVIPAGGYISWIVGTELYLVQSSGIIYPPKFVPFSWGSIIDPATMPEGVRCTFYQKDFRMNTNTEDSFVGIGPLGVDSTFITRTGQFSAAASGTNYTIWNSMRFSVVRFGSTYYTEVDPITPNTRWSTANNFDAALNEIVATATNVGKWMASTLGALIYRHTSTTQTVGQVRSSWASRATPPITLGSINIGGVTKADTDILPAGVYAVTYDRANLTFVLIGNVDPGAIVSYKTETLLDNTPSLTSETYLQLTNVPAGNYLAFYRLTMNLTAIGSRHWCSGITSNNAAIAHPTGTHSTVSITADAYTVNYPHVANGSTPIVLSNPTNTVEVKGQLYGTDSATGENISHGHLTLIKL